MSHFEPTFPCHKCAQPIRLKTITVRDARHITFPVNPDGSRHSPSCNRIVKGAKQIYSTVNLEQFCK